MKRFAITFLLASTAISASAFAQDTMYVAGYGGSFQKVMEQDVIAPFAAAHNVKITYVPGISSETIAKMQAQKGNQQINVAIADDGPMYQAIQLGYCDKLAKAPVYDDLYEFSRFGGNAIGIGVVATGIAYNADAFKKKGWAAPASWKDLTDKKYSQRFTTSSLSGTYGIHTLVMYARLNGGNETNIEPGFEAIRKTVAPNVVSWSSSPAQLADMFQNGDVDVAVWGSSRAYALKDSGFPVEFVYPKEGAVALISAACPVVQNSLPELSQQFVQWLVTPEMQAKLAAQGFGPTNRKTKLDAKLAAEVPYGEEKVGNLVPMNWTVINQKRAEWTNEWNRTVEK
jgi:putative spermidine/putrescine transport system substrate-binding protein